MMSIIYEELGIFANELTSTGPEGRQKKLQN
jgi:hypothetical protein